MVFQVGLTSVGEELSIDLFEGFFIDHTAGALLCEGEREAQWSMTEGFPRVGWGNR